MTSNLKTLRLAGISLVCAVAFASTAYGNKIPYGIFKKNFDWQTQSSYVETKYDFGSNFSPPRGLTFLGHDNHIYGGLGLLKKVEDFFDKLKKNGPSDPVIYSGQLSLSSTLDGREKSVPDGGSTLALMGIAVLGLAGIRRFWLKS